MIVTKVEPLSKTKYKIYLNHQFAFVLYKGELRSYKISDGRELSEEELDEIREKILLKRAKKKVDVRTADEREMQKIYGYLGRKGFRYDVVRQVIQNSIENA